MAAFMVAERKWQAQTLRVKAAQHFYQGEVEHARALFEICKQIWAEMKELEAEVEAKRHRRAALLNPPKRWMQ